MYFQQDLDFKWLRYLLRKIFDLHVDFVKLVKTDDNYKNILQVKIQKEFKITPDYLEINHDPETGYHMGVYICLNQQIHQVKHNEAIPFSAFGNFANIQEKFQNEEPIFIYLSSGTHKIKKKAEQMACEQAIGVINNSEPSTS